MATKKPTALSQLIATALKLDPAVNPALSALIEIEAYIKENPEDFDILNDKAPAHVRERDEHNATARAVAAAYGIYAVGYSEYGLSLDARLLALNFVLYQVTSGGRLKFNRTSFKDYDKTAPEHIKALKAKADAGLLENPEAARAQFMTLKTYQWTSAALRFYHECDDLYTVATNLKKLLEDEPINTYGAFAPLMREFLGYFEKKRTPSEEQRILKTYEAIGYGPEARARMAFYSESKEEPDIGGYYRYLRSTKEYKALKKAMEEEAQPAPVEPKPVEPKPEAQPVEPKPEAQPVAQKPKKPSWRDGYFSDDDLKAMGAALGLFLEQKTDQLKKPQRRLLNRLLCFLGERVSLSQENEARALIAKHMGEHGPNARIFSAGGVSVTFNV